MKWTERQQKAITEKEKTLLVAAAAGSGKTAVLVERIKNLIIQDRVPVESLLVVTFTNAAAAEMKEKITRSLIQELEGEGGGDPAFLRQQLNQLYKANISTFHSFALEVIRRYFYVLPIEPGFRICDEGESILLKTESMDELFEEKFLEEDPTFLDFLGRYAGGKTESGAKAMVDKAYTSMMSIPEPFEWLDRKIEELKQDQEQFLVSPLAEEIRMVIHRLIRLAAQSFQRVSDLLDEAGIPELHEKAEVDLTMILELQERLDGSNLQEAMQLAENLQYQRFKASKENQPIYEEMKPLVDKIRNRGKEYIKGIRKLTGGRTLEDHLKDIQDTYPMTLVLRNLLDRYHQIFQEKKRDKNLLDFSDIEHFALKILQDDQAAEEYRQHFRYIFIDEYQDSNLLQEALISRIQRENNLFMVGDVKQSIYKFRLAEPEIFLGKYHRFRKGEDPREEVVDLNQNFRSKGPVIRAVNEVFSKVMEGYDEEAALYQGVPYEGELDHPAELHILDEHVREEEELPEELQELKRAELEAHVAADLIRQQIGKPIYDFRKDQQRLIQKKDIVILMRGTRNYADKFRQILIQENLPAHVEDGDGYFDTLEIGQMMNMLRVIDNKRQDIPLLSLLHSPVFQFTVNELAEIRIHRKKGSFFQALEEFALISGRDLLCNKAAASLRRIEEWQELSRSMPLDEFVWKLMKETGYYLYAGALPGGVQRQANLRLLVDRCIQFQKGSMKGLYGFIRYIDAIRDKSVRTGQISLISENDDVIRIMTIHKSKGLEFPVVLVAGLGKRFNFSSDTSHLDVHKDLGISLSMMEENRRYFRKTLIQTMIKQKNRMTDMEEEIRILYVAFTRAMDKLILLGTVPNLEKAKEKIDSLETGDLMAASTYLEVLLPSLEGSSIRPVYHKVQEIVPLAGEKNPQGDNIRKLLEGKGEEQEELSGEVARRLDFQYPYPDAVRQKTKVTVTELNQGAIARKDKGREGEPLKRPLFEIGVRELTAAERGTLIHDIMMRLDFKESDRRIREGSTEHLGRYLDQQLDWMEERKIITREERGMIPKEKILRFFQSPIGQRALRSTELQKERPFTLLKNLHGEDVLVQGIIDCFFEEEGQIVLLDYKTNYVMNPDDPAELTRIGEMYRDQLMVYREALEAATGKEVKESILYLFGADREIRIE